MRLTVVIAALALGACTTTPAMETALAPLNGQPVQLVFDRLGPPAGYTQMGTDTVYMWNLSSMVPGASLANGIPAGSPPSPDAPTSGTYSGAAVAVECNVQIVADAQGRIKDSDYIGGKGGCREPARKLRQLAYSG